MKKSWCMGVMLSLPHFSIYFNTEYKSKQDYLFCFSFLSCVIITLVVPPPNTWKCNFDAWDFWGFSLRRVSSRNIPIFIRLQPTCGLWASMEETLNPTFIILYKSINNSHAFVTFKKIKPRATVLSLKIRAFCGHDFFSLEGDMTRFNGLMIIDI